MRLAVLLLALWQAPCQVSGKVVDGWMKLTSEDCEQFVAKFSFSPKQTGRIAGHFFSDVSTTAAREHSDYFDGHPHALQISMFSDTQWVKYRAMLSQGSLCKDRMGVASFNKKIRPSHTAKADAEKSAKRTQGQSEFDFAADIPAMQHRSHFWYVMIADCYLEEYDAHPPKLSFVMEFLNGKSHLPSEEDGLLAIHGSIFVAMAIFAVVGGFAIRKQLKRAGQIHLTLLILAMSYATEMLSVLMELTHLWVYSMDGKGMRWRHGRLPFDFGADVFQNTSELLLTSLLVAISFGWTMQGDFTRDAVFGTVTRGQLAVFVVIVIGSLQLLLEYVGRFYEEDFNSFHDHEHWPGTCLMLLRVALAGLLWFGVRHTLTQRNKAAVAQLLSRLRLAGIGWLLSFPILVLIIAPMASESSRHAVVTAGALISQCAALVAAGAQLLNMDSDFFKGSTLAKMGTMFADHSEDMMRGAARAGAAGALVSMIRKKVAVD